MRLYVGDQYHLLHWAAKRFGIESFPSDSEAIAVMGGEKNTQILAVFVLNGIHNNQCSAHIASNNSGRWATNQVLRRLAGYVFEFKELNRVNLNIRRDNVAAQVLALKAGFQFEGILQQGFEVGTDSVLMGMTRDMCPWIRQKEIDDGFRE